MNRLPVVAFATLVVATIAAFVITQHLKVSNPLINGSPRPDPAAINPIGGRVCRDTAGKLVSFKRTRVSFFLQSRSDTVIVEIVDSNAQDVATIASGRYMRAGQRVEFSWNGREGAHSNGPVAPEGTYYFHVALQHAGRAFTLQQPITILTTAPHPAVTRVSVLTPAAAPRLGAPSRAATASGSASASGSGTGSAPAVIAPPAQAVAIRYRPGNYRNAYIHIYRTDLPGRPRLVASFRVFARRGKGTWNGLIGGRPAPAGTYLVGIVVTDAACNLGAFPPVNPPAPGTTPGTGVTVLYLAAQPALTPVPAGASAGVLVNSAARPYAWSLRRAGSAQVIARGAASRRAVLDGSGVALRARIPARGAGLYELSITSGGRRTAVPLLASASGRRAAVPVLVVLPALTWQGENPLDDTGDGLPNTLADGQQIDVQRPLVGGLPPDLPGEAALLAYLDSRHMAYQLTSDLALAEGVGPQLSAYRGVVLDGSFLWTPPVLQAMLRAFAQNGGRVLSIGISSLLQSAPLIPGASATLAGPPSPPATRDVFGAQPGPVSTGNTDLITTLQDPLRIFTTTSGALSGFSSFQTLAPPATALASSVSMAGIGTMAPSIIGFPLSRGIVVEIGLVDFTASLAHDVDSQELIGRLWQLLSGGR